MHANASPNSATRRRKRATESELLEVIENAARGGSWNAAAWLLERRWAHKYRLYRLPASVIKPEAEPEAKPEPDPFADVVKLAA